MKYFSSLRTRRVKQSRKQSTGLLRRSTPRNDDARRVHLIPAILAKNEADFRRDWQRIKGVTRALHVDVGDGKFVATKTWADPDVIRRLRIPGLEVHLMVQHPERVVGRFVKAGAKRVILHVESATPTLLLPLLAPLSGASRGRKIELGLAINPATSVSRLKPFLSVIDFVLVMSVVPGAQGRPFDRRAIVKIRQLKRTNPQLVVAVDGGLNERTIPAVVKAGADRLIVGSAIVGAKNPVGALKKLMRLAVC